jgi:hypothetical protein
VNVRRDLSFGRECQRFTEVLTRADDRPSDRNPLENDVEDGGGEVTRG